MLTEDHKLQRVEISQRLLLRANKTMEMRIRRILVRGLVEAFKQRITYFDNLIIGDETWVHQNTPETKRDSMNDFKTSILSSDQKVQSAEVRS
ncbi:hypothetical protein ElyMa_006357100 [Elysia marginata]|uniref:Uncharacterized protein n=1 Tax=Elysia marginata TaxID=1093978 RepID=A0AAV4HM02_9GAST|nr:hypothetical protein ElyMa_006357100 [Elysia marginata]